MARKEFPKKVQRDAFMRCRGFCEGDGCGAKLTLGKFAYDHRNPDGLTGEPTLENCQVLCTPCHAEKTKQDVEAIARAKRREDAHHGITDPHRRKLAGPGFRPALKRHSASRPLNKWFGPSLERSR